MKKISVKKGAALAMMLVAGYAFMGCSHSSDSSEDTVAENPGNTDDGSGDVIDAGGEGNKSSGNEDSPEDETNGESDVKVTAIEISGSSNVAKGSSVTLKATVSPSNATAKGVSWSTDVSEGVSVANGKVSVDSSCTATEINVTATAKDGSGVSATYKISVVDVSSISAGITITEEKGWLETAYIKWNAASSEMIDGYNVYVKGLDGEYEKIDDMLVRAYSSTAGGSTIDYYRADALGLKAGVYQMKVVGTTGGIEAPNVYSESSAITVEAHDRSGFAFTGETTPGAYNADGTLKDGAKVLYVTKDTAKTVSTTVNGANSNPCVGLQAILAGYEKGKDTTPIAIRFIGLVTKDDLDSIGSSAEGLQIKGKTGYSKIPITIEGVGDDASIFDFGFLIKNASYLEMRNLGILKCIDDGVSIDTKNSYLWIHNLDIFYGYYGSGDHAKGDGSTDMKDDSKYLTISYIHYYDTGKCVLCGMKSETGPNYITFHHNWFDHSDSRHPRIRTMSVHVYNNYYDGNSKYGVGATTGADAFVENNYFRNCKFPMLSSLQGNDVYAGTATYNADYGTFSSEAPGSIKAFNNYIEGSTTSYWPYSGTGTAWTKGTSGSIPDGIDTTKHFDAYEVSSRSATVPASVVGIDGTATYSNFDTDSSVNLGVDESAIETPQNARATVMAKSGRLGGGDFKWTFSETDDTDYGVNAELKAALLSYKSKLVKVMGDSSSGSDASGNDDGSDDNGGSTGGTESGEAGGTTPATMPEGTVVVTFDSFTSGATVNGVTITGSLKSGIAEKTYNGTTYKTALKMESSTSISFTLSAASTLTIVTDTASKKIKIGEDAYQTDSDGVVTQSLSAGSYTVTKKDSMNVYAIIIEPAE
ncbi:MAG: hypothetical protein IKP49_01265 [Treponema sp.]|nr:hypothetical protein [Treponema sp.]